MAAAKTKKWSQHVTETSNAMDLAPNVFKQTSAKKIAEDIEHDAETSNRRKSTPYRSAMSMLMFYINRAGKDLSPKQSARRRKGRLARRIRPRHCQASAGQKENAVS
jgi:hypothetical protein